MNWKKYLVFQISWGSSRLIGSIRVTKDDSFASLIYYILEEFLHMLYPFTFLFWDYLYIWVFSLLSCEYLGCIEDKQNYTPDRESAYSGFGIAARRNLDVWGYRIP